MGVALVYEFAYEFRGQLGAILVFTIIVVGLPLQLMTFPIMDSWSDSPVPVHVPSRGQSLKSKAEVVGDFQNACSTITPCAYPVTSVITAVRETTVRLLPTLPCSRLHGPFCY